LKFQVFWQKNVEALKVGKKEWMERRGFNLMGCLECQNINDAASHGPAIKCNDLNCWASP
jgi:hypothetical protein